MYESKIFDLSFQPQESIELDVHLIPKTKEQSTYMSYFFPGLGQFYAERKFMAFTYGTLTISSIIGGITSELSIANHSTKYKKNKSSYLSATTDEEIALFRKKVKGSYNDIKNSQRLRNTFIGALAFIWAANIIDSYLYSWPEVNDLVEPNLGFMKTGAENNALAINIQMEF